MRITKRALLSAFVVLLATLLASPTQARRKKRKSRSKVVLVGCTDKAHKKVRGVVEKALKKKRFKVVEADEEDSGLAAEHQAVAIVLCRVDGEGSEWTATVEIKNGATGSSLVKSTFEAKKLRKLHRAMRKTLWKEIQAAMSEAAAPGQEPSGEPADDGAVADKGDSGDETGDETSLPPEEMGTEEFRELDDDDPGDRRTPPRKATTSAGVSTVAAAGAPAPLEVHAGLRTFRRSLGFDLATVPSYSLPFATAVEFGAAWYPMAHLMGRTDILSHIGITFDMATAFGLDTSSANDPTAFPTVSNSFLGGVRGYHPFGKHRAQLDLGFGGQSFIIKNSNGMPRRSDFPNVKYRFLRFAASGLYTINDKMSAGGSFGYRMVLSSGELEDGINFYPGASVSGIDFGAFFSYTIMKNIHARASFDMVRYGFSSLNANVGDPDSGSDTYISGSLSAVYTFSN